MPLAEVTALNKNDSRQKTFVLQKHQPAADEQALAELAVWCEQFSPIVGLEEGETPSSLLLDVTGLANLFGGEEQLVHCVYTAFEQRGFHVRIGVANTIGQHGHWPTTDRCLVLWDRMTLQHHRQLPPATLPGDQSC